jgi:hypothetical protein
VSTSRKTSAKAGAAKKPRRKVAVGNSRGSELIVPGAPFRGPATNVYQVTIMAPGRKVKTLETLLRKAFGNTVDVKQVEPTVNTSLIRQAPGDDMAALEANNIKQEFAVRKALLSKALPIDQVCELLGIKSRQTLHNWISQGKILALPDNDRILLPLWQFDASTDDKIVTGFTEALRTLKRSTFSAAHWFTNPNVQLGNKSPIALLRAGKIAKVVDEAALAGHLS